VECRTVSNVFDKSKAMTTTYGLDRSRSVTVCKRVMMAASVEPVGRNANWSENFNDGGGLRKAEYRKLRTTDCSMILVRIGVMEMGRKSATSLVMLFWESGRCWPLSTAVAQ